MLSLVFGKREEKRAQVPATVLSNPDNWLLEAWSTVSASGIKISPESALNYDCVFRATDLISGTIAKIPLLTYKRKGDGKERAVKHPTYNLLRYNVNTAQNSFHFKYLLQSHALNWGNGFALIERDPEGRPSALFPLPPDPDHTQPIINSSGVVNYKVTMNEEKFTFSGDDILHIRGLGDRLWGFSRIMKARESIGLGLAAQRFGSVFFKNGARPVAVLQHPGALEEADVERLKNNFSKIHTGVENWHKLMILEEGMTLNPFSMSNEDAQFLQSRAFQPREIANFYGLPPHKLGDPTRTAFASLEQENQSLIDDCYDNWMCAWEAECRFKLLNAKEKANDSIVIEFLRQALVRADLAARQSFYASAILNGYMNRDEVRARENLNPIPDGEGKKFFMPANMLIVGEEPPDPMMAPAPPAGTAPPPAGEEEDPDPEEEDDREATRMVIEDLSRRMINKVLSMVKSSGKKNLFELTDYIETKYEKDAEEKLSQAAAPAIRLLKTDKEKFLGCFNRHMKNRVHEIVKQNPEHYLEQLDMFCEMSLEAESNLVSDLILKECHVNGKGNGKK